MYPEENRELELRIFLDVEACCRIRGLIKSQNGYEYYAEGAEAFIDKMAKEIKKKYKKEKAGKIKPYFTGKLGLESAISVACNKRINDLWKKNIFWQIYMNSAVDEFIVSVQGDAIDDSSELRMEAARIENVSSRFGEPINAYNQTALSALEESELFSAFETAFDRLSSIGKNGKLYFRTIQFYLEDFDDKMSKKDEISALTVFLGVTRKKAINTKHWAQRFLKRELSHFIDFDGYEKSMKRKRELAERFKKISNDDLLKSYDKRYSFFLNPYLGQRIACTIRVLSLINGEKCKKTGGVKPTVAEEKSVYVENEVA